MNLESILEDIEAQGYFQSVASAIPPSETTKLVNLEFAENHSAPSRLLSPLLGTDFIAGFDVRSRAPVWFLIPLRRIESIQVDPTKSQLLTTNLKLNKLISKKLVGQRVKIFTALKVHSGKIVSVTKSLILLTGDTEKYVALSAISCIAVENISELL